MPLEDPVGEASSRRLLAEVLTGPSIGTMTGPAEHRLREEWTLVTKLWLFLG